MRGLSPGTDRLSSASGCCWLPPKSKDLEATKVDRNSGESESISFITDQKVALELLDYRGKELCIQVVREKQLQISGRMTVLGEIAKALRAECQDKQSDSTDSRGNLIYFVMYYITCY